MAWSSQMVVVVIVVVVVCIGACGQCLHTQADLRKPPCAGPYVCATLSVILLVGFTILDVLPLCLGCCGWGE